MNAIRIIAAAVVLLVAGCSSPSDPWIYDFEHNGHRYLSFVTGGHRGGVEHDPDCPHPSHKAER